MKARTVLPTQIALQEHAFFLDFDGTLARFGVPKLHNPQLDPRLLPALARIQTANQGALAIVTGRDIPEVNILLAPFRTAVSGSHGAQILRAPGANIETVADISGMDEIFQGLSTWVEQTPGVLILRKQFTVVLDFRNQSGLLDHVEATVKRFIAPHPALTLLHGHGSIEIKARNTSKGTAVVALSEQAPFAGRIPVFIGDDIADEAGFEVVNRHPHGISIKVGEAKTCARYRLKDDAAVRDWLVAVSSS